MAQTAHAQWTQQGGNLPGNAANDLAGGSISLSSDGQTVAVGARGSNTSTGEVKIYKLENGSWTQQGSTISGDANSNLLGQSVSLSSDGETIAVGAPNASSGLGQVKVYKLENGAWSLQGNVITGDAGSTDVAGSSVSLSSDGLTVAVGAPGNFAQRGQVRVYKLESGTWTLQGSAISGDAVFERTGFSVSLSSDGLTVALGAPNKNSNAGQVKIYKLESGTWTLQGSAIPGDAGNDQAGYSVSLSSDGQTVALGAPYASSATGKVKIYKLESGTWTLQGSVINGDGLANGAGWSVALASNGQTVAVGAPNNNSGVGQVKVYKLSSGSWTLQGSAISGTAGSDVLAGYSVSLSSDGKTVALGAPNSNSLTGLGKVYRFCDLSVSITPLSSTICEGSPTTLTAVSGADSYIWSNGQTTAVIDVSPSIMTTYSVTAISGVCSATASATVSVNPTPTASILPTTATVCAGQSATLTASGGNTYLWSTGDITAQISATATGTYSVTVTNTVGCSATASAGVVVNDPVPTPTLAVNALNSTPGSVTVIQNTPFLTLTASGCSGTLNWTGPNNPSGSSVSVPTATTGTLSYTVYCELSGCTSSTATFTVEVVPGSTVGSFDGFVNGADCGTFRGWAWDRNKINTAVAIEILDGATIIGTLSAGDFRQDLLDAGKGNGKHAFRFTIPESVKDGLSHNLSARVAGSSFILKDSPKALICTGTAPVGNKPPQPPTPTVLIAPLAAQVGVPFSGTLVPFTDPENTVMTYALSVLPDGLAINSGTRVISGTPTVAGSFVLTYSATDQGGANNSVSFVLVVNPASTTTVTGSFEGYLDKVECGTIRGWVWDRKLPNTPLTVEFYHNLTNEVYGSTVANISRQDLKDAGKGNGVHAYSFTVPNTLKDGVSRPIAARVLGSTYVLKDAPKVLTCQPLSPARLSAETAGLQVTVLGNPIVGSQIVVEVRGAQGQPLRLQLTDIRGQLVADSQIGKADPVQRQTLNVATQSSGLFLLRATSGLQSVTLKVLKP